MPGTPAQGRAVLGGLARGRYALLGLVICALGALAGMADVSSPVSLSAARQAALRAAPASTSLRACAAPGTAGQGAGVALIAAGRPGSGAAVITGLTAPGAAAAPALRTLSQPGTLAVVGIPAQAWSSKARHGRGTHVASPAQQAPVMIAARGSMAQGLEAEQASDGGVVTASCPGPGTDFWFAMPGQRAASLIDLVLMNVDSQTSQVDADLFTDAGPVQTGADSGISVPGHGVVVLPLAGLVRGSQAVALHVRTSAGRIAAAVRESAQAGQEGQWIPAGQPPSTRLVVPALPGTRGERQFFIADPGGANAMVRLTAITAGGSYEPAGSGVIDVPAASASRISLPSLSSVTGAAVLTANVPVIAAMAAPGGQAGGPGALTASAPPVREQAVVADAGQGSDVTELVLSATGRAARVSIRAGASGLTAAPGARTVTVAARRSVTVKVDRPPGVAAGAPFAIVVTPLPGSGPVWAGRVLIARDGSLLGLMPMMSALTTVPLTPVREALTAAGP